MQNSISLMIHSSRADRYGRRKFMMFGLTGYVVFGTPTGLTPYGIWILRASYISNRTQKTKNTN